jgi:hypothetical protein
MKKARVRRSRRAESRPTTRVDARDRILIALTDKPTILRVLEATHSASEWANAALSSSRSELTQGLELVEAERTRLEERLRMAKTRGRGLPEGLGRSATDAACERIECRLVELREAATHLTSLKERARAELEVESIEWQRPLTVGDGEVEIVGYVDLWVSVRTATYRIQQGTDPWDAEGRPRYEGCSLHHLVRTIAIQVEPTIRSLSAVVRRVRFVQTHARSALNLVVTCDRFGTEVLAAQGIPTFVWTPETVSKPSTPKGALPARGPRVPALGTVEIDGPSRPSLPSPRPSLPPAPLG